jgi:hypothetical protein
MRPESQTIGLHLPTRGTSLVSGAARMARNRGLMRWRPKRYPVPLMPRSTKARLSIILMPR